MRVWFRQWRRRRQATAAHSNSYFRPTLEALEERYLLTGGYVQTNLLSDVPGQARFVDPNLVNPWGIAYGPTGAFWIGENGTGVSDLSDGTGQLLPLVVSIPGAGGGSGPVTGTVFNSGPDFQISENGVSGPARFLFASEDGVLSAWNPTVDNTHALLAVDNSSTGASYKGMALATDGAGQTLLYVADFGRGSVDVFDGSFHQVLAAGAFQDPDLPAGYAPFNVANVNGRIFVTYALKETDGIDDVPGAGHGFIDVYSPDGTLVQHFASGGPLDSPWGMTLAPAGFGAFGGDLLVGNNGDGRINAYDPTTGAFLGTLTDTANNPIVIDRLWGLSFGNDHLAGSAGALFFTAGIGGEQHGLFGALQTPAAAQAGTAGPLPYDPRADDDGYPLPPANGPALQADSSSPSATPVLLPVTGSSALAPTLAVAPPASAPSPGSSTFADLAASSQPVQLAGLLPTAIQPADSAAAFTPGAVASLGVTGLGAAGTGGTPALSAFAGSGASTDEAPSADAPAQAASRDASSLDSPAAVVLEPDTADKMPVAMLDALPTPEAARTLSLPVREAQAQATPPSALAWEALPVADSPRFAAAAAALSPLRSRWLPLTGALLLLGGALGWRRFPGNGRRVFTSLVAAIQRLSARPS